MPWPDPNLGEDFGQLVDAMMDADLGETIECEVDYNDEDDITFTVTVDVHEEPTSFGFIGSRRQADLTVSLHGGGSHTETILIAENAHDVSFSVFEMMEYRLVEDGKKDSVPSIWDGLRQSWRSIFG